MKEGTLTTADLWQCATDIEAKLLEQGDPFIGDDWSMMQVVRAYLADHPGDDDTPIDPEWMQSMGWAYLDAGVWMLKTEDGHTADANQEYWYVGLQLNTVGQSLQIVADHDRESVEMVAPCRTRGDIRRIHALFCPVPKVAQ